MASNNKNNNNNIKTYRHEFGKEFMSQLSMFSKVHQYDDRHMYKSEWTKWVQQEDIAQALDTEKRRLQENGYTGDIDDKMFKAGRYYFRKKTTTTNKTSATSTPTSTVDAEPMNPRRRAAANARDDNNISKPATRTTTASSIHYDVEGHNSTDG